MIERPRLLIAVAAATVLVVVLVFLANPDERPGPSAVETKASNSAVEGEQAKKTEAPVTAEQRWQPVSSQELKKTDKSIALTLMVSHKSVEVLASLRRPIPFRFDSMRAGGYRAHVLDSQMRELSIPVELPGLLPPAQAALADENGEVTLGDEVFSLQVPVIVVVPDLPVPFTVTLKGPEGVVMGAAVVTAVKDKLAR